jgi:hypothetical protein
VFFGYVFFISLLILIRILQTDTFLAKKHRHWRCHLYSCIAARAKSQLEERDRCADSIEFPRTHTLIIESFECGVGLRAVFSVFAPVWTVSDCISVLTKIVPVDNHPEGRRIDWRFSTDPKF